MKDKMREKAEDIVLEHGSSLCYAHDGENECDEERLCESCKEMADDVFKLLNQVRKEAFEKAAAMIEGHRCDVTCGNPFMGKVLADAIREEMNKGEG